MLVLAIESSCDETAAAVVRDRQALSNVIASQVEEHKKFGGVVPEIASRRHVENISWVVSLALEKAGCQLADIDGIAVTFAPGLIGALLVGVNFAKGMALASRKPLIPVHHLRSHIAANYVTHPELEPPFLCLVVSGGHSHIVEVLDYTRFRVVGRTRDDAAGECFDKTARAMGMPYPGGVHLDRIAEEGDATVYRLPSPKVEGSPYDFSFSGLKTAVVNLIHNKQQKGEDYSVPDLAACVRAGVCDQLCSRLVQAAQDLGYRRIALAGGVSANRQLRRQMEELCSQRGWELYYPEASLCGDNAVMVGVQGCYELAAGHRAGQDLNACATLPIDYDGGMPNRRPAYMDAIADGALGPARNTQ